MGWSGPPPDVRELRRQQLFEAFSPAAPVDRRALFAGRSDELAAVQEVLLQRGQHAVIYGERGVGKTSMAKVARELAGFQQVFTAHVTCDSSDSYTSIWRKVFEEIAVTGDEAVGVTVTGSHYLRPGDLTPNEIRLAFRDLTQVCPALVFIDEFDVVKDEEVHRFMAETIKVLSDQAVDATMVIVGVAENVNDLIAQHESTARNLVQVRMPRMELGERIEIIRRGLAAAETTITSEAESRIATLSQGLPQFVHLIGQRSALAALNNDRDRSR